MTKRERVFQAIRFESPERAPYDVGFTHQMLEKMIAYTGDADFSSRIGNHITSAYLIKPEVEIKPDYFADEFSVIWNKSGADKDIGVIEGILLENPEDLDTFELPPVDTAYIHSRMEDLMAHRGDRFTVAAIGFSLFERAWTLRGMENLLCDMIVNPDFVHRLLARIAARNLEILDIALSYDIDCFHFGDDWGQQRGLIMGPRCWRTFIKPYLSQMYDRVRQAGKVVSQHSCGDIREIMDDLREMGLSIYQTYQPEIYGLDFAQNLVGWLTIWGGISTQRDLPYATPDQVEQLTRDLLAAFPTGGLIAAPTHAVPSDVPPANILAMLRVLQG